MSNREAQSISIPELELALGDQAAALREDPRAFYGFLPDAFGVAIKDDCVVISGPRVQDAKRDEIFRLFKKAGQRSQKGEQAKARDISSEVIKLDPMLAQARLSFGVSCLQLGERGAARDQILASVKLEPTNALALYWLAEVLLEGEKVHPESERLVRRALQLSPNEETFQEKLLNLLALAGKHQEGLKACDEIRARGTGHDLEPYYRAMFLIGLRDWSAAAENLQACISKYGETASDATEQMRDLYASVQSSRAKEKTTEAWAVVDQVAARAGEISGFPVQMTEGSLEAMVGAKVAMAWKHNTGHHLLTIRKDTDEKVKAHHALHELHHVLMESEARKAGANKWFITTPQSREKAFGDLDDELQRMLRKGYDAGDLAELNKRLYHGAVSFLYNCPLDMRIEKRIREDFPQLEAVHFCGVHKLAKDGLSATLREDLKGDFVSPTMRRISDTLNGTYAIFVDQLLGKTTSFAAHYRLLPSFALSQELYGLWQEADAKWSPGDEYSLVDRFAEALGMTDWYGWREDQI